jgi:hypothetical protein
MIRRSESADHEEGIIFSISALYPRRCASHGKPEIVFWFKREKAQ